MHVQVGHGSINYDQKKYEDMLVSGCAPATVIFESIFKNDLSSYAETLMRNLPVLCGN